MEDYEEGGAGTCDLACMGDPGIFCGESSMKGKKYEKCFKRKDWKGGGGVCLTKEPIFGAVREHQQHRLSAGTPSVPSSNNPDAWIV